MKVTGELFMPIVLALVLAVASANLAYADNREASGQATSQPSAIHDAWIKGKVEMALLLNRYLNSFRIHTDVKASTVTLSGAVNTDIDRDLAEQIALGINGVQSVKNNLKVDKESKQQAASSHEDQREFLQRIEDLTTTARVKSRLLLNKNVAAMRINVDTANGVVTLKGDVDNGEQRDLALRIAENTNEVRKVQDNLTVKPRRSAVAGR